MSGPAESSAIKDRVRSQFGPAAEQYVHSATHAQGDDLAILIDLAEPKPTDIALDIATGGGHVALRLSHRVQRVVATDLTPAMLDAARNFILSRGVTNVTFELADAEELPFPDESFDLVTTRIAPHHFADVRAYVHEVARVLKPGGRFALEDSVAPDDPELSALLNEVERRRDPSHVRTYTLKEWTAFLRESGLTIERYEFGSKRLAFDDWTARMDMGAEEKAALERLMSEAPAEAREFLGVESGDGHVVAWESSHVIIRAAKR
jgi:SAM-dependent methyltransferase